MNCDCLFGAYRRINPCGSLASDDIKLNMFAMFLCASVYM